MTTGWTFEQGAVGEEVAKGVTIYSSTSCLSILKAGSDISSAQIPSKGNTEDFAEAVIKEDETTSAVKTALSEYLEKKDNLQAQHSSYSQSAFNQQLWCMSYVKKCSKTYSKKFGIDTVEYQTAMNTALQDAEYKRHLNIMTDTYAIASDYTTELEKLEKDFQAKWGKQAKELGLYGSSSEVKQEPVTPPIVEAQKQMEKDMDNLTDKIRKTDLTAGAADGLMAWIEAVEEYVDNMPQFKENTSPLYEVEKKDDGTWVYTGNSAVADPEYNKRVREFKQKACKKLNSLMEEASKKVETKLNDLAKKCSPIMPMIQAIKVIKGGLSLSTIVDWGKAAINMFTSIYQMFYNTYKSIMELMEIIVIKFPQLISKVMAKIVEFDCPIQKPSISVKVPKIPTTKKNKTSGGIAGDDITTA